MVSSFFYENASVVALLIFWQFAFLAIVVFSMFVAAFFSKTTRATLVGVIGKKNLQLLFMNILSQQTLTDNIILFQKCSSLVFS